MTTQTVLRGRRKDAVFAAMFDKLATEKLLAADGFLRHPRRPGRADRVAGLRNWSQSVRESAEA